MGLKFKTSCNYESIENIVCLFPHKPPPCPVPQWWLHERLSVPPPVLEPGDGAAGGAD